MIKVGFIGLGTMGEPMSRNFLKAGYNLSVYDVNLKVVDILVNEGAKACSSPREVGANSDVVITMLPNSTIVEKVIIEKDSVMEGIASGGIIIDMSSSQPSSTQKIANILKEKGIEMLDAPVSGGPPGAAAGKLSIMVGGKKEMYEKCLPLLEVLGSKIFHVGEAGAGHIVKAVNNLLFGTTLVAAVEAIVLGVKAGIAPEKLVEVISVSSGRCYAVDTKFPNIVFPRHFKPGFTTDLLYKDLDIALTLAKELKVPTAVSNVAQQLYMVGQQKGFGRMDNTAVIKILEEIVGIEVKPYLDSNE
ncbi:MAG: tRNA methyltransferase [Clostridiaceae bacterium BRH_c20a]|nr:MAG: tRNA methyltransferase [Clostridiaceae bacterium BRH_c20a]